MTKEEVEKAFGDISPYYAYKQGVQDGAANNEESFRREAAKDILAGMLSAPVLINIGGKQLKTFEDFANTAIGITDVLIAKLKEK